MFSATLYSGLLADAASVVTILTGLYGLYFVGKPWKRRIKRLVEAIKRWWNGPPQAPAE
jgi:hypothetical protein